MMSLHFDIFENMFFESRFALLENLTFGCQNEQHFMDIIDLGVIFILIFNDLVTFFNIDKSILIR